MNADEIVKRLREYASRCDGAHRCWHAPTLNVAADFIESLQAQLAESQRREKAAVEDIADMEKSLPFGVGCYYCRHYTPAGGDGECSDGCNFEWRGLQAGEESR